MLKDFSQRRGTPYIDITLFHNELLAQSFLKRRQKPQKWGYWLTNLDSKIEKGLENLVNEKYCQRKKVQGAETIFLPGFFMETAYEIWTELSLDDVFPNEEKFKFDIPSDLIITVQAEKLTEFLEQQQKNNIPLIRIVFDNGTNAIVPSRFLKVQILDISISKIKNFIVLRQNRDSCKEYIKKAMPDMHPYVDSVFKTLFNEQVEVIQTFYASDEATYMFWDNMCKCIYEKNTTKTDAVVFQAASIIKAYNNFYHEIMLKEIGDKSILKDIKFQMTSPPYFYNINMILKFSDEIGRDYSESVSYNELVNMLSKKTHITNSENLPDILSFIDNKKEKWFVSKDFIFKAFEFRITKIASIIVEEIKKEWEAIIFKYQFSQEMKSDESFEKLVLEKIVRMDPFLIIIYLDKRLLSIHKEIKNKDMEDSFSSKIFNEELIQPFHKILEIDRKELQKEIRSEMPFWYRISFIVAVIRLLRGIQ
jgi:hypothetical protein